MDAPDEAALAIVARHALHDEELISGLAGADLDEAEAAKARTLVERCPTCRELHADLIVINDAVKAAGTATAVAAVRSAPRDFRLTPEMVGIGRPASPLARLGARFATSVHDFGRPLGVSFATLGIVGLLVGSLGLGPELAADSATSGAPGGEPPGVVTGPSSSQRSAAEPSASEVFVSNSKGGGGLDASGPSTRALLFLGSAALLVSGFVLILTTRRTRSRAAP
jgi:hypothetical protein